LSADTTQKMMRGWMARGHPGRRSEAEQRRRDAELLHGFETEPRKVGWGDPAFAVGEEHDLYRFHDGRFAFSRDHADWVLLRKKGRVKGF
jgi:hypothetical protein